VFADAGSQLCPWAGHTNDSVRVEFESNSRWPPAAKARPGPILGVRNMDMPTPGEIKESDAGDLEHRLRLPASASHGG